MGGHGGGGSPDPEVAPHPRRWLILYILCLSLTMVVISMSSLNVALPSMQRGARRQRVGPAMDRGRLRAGLRRPAAAVRGPSATAWGRKRVLLAGMTLFGTLSALAAFSTSPAEIIVYRAGLGVAAALVMPATLSIATVIFPALRAPQGGGRLGGVRRGRRGAIGPTHQRQSC